MNKYVKSERSKYLEEKLLLVPHLPGSYQMRDESNTVIYVGKAKDLHNRVNSYFHNDIYGKTAKLVSNIYDFTYVITSSEYEAFLLEINLIKKYNPKYNILLRDDKSYPYIEYMRYPYPMVKEVRYLNIKKKAGRYLFGPYVNGTAARKIVELLNRLYPLKKCEGKPKEVCLYYHLHECLGYCVKQVDEDKINQMENEILGFLNGNNDLIIKKLKNEMEIQASNLNFEEAQELKEYLEYINVILEKQKIDIQDLVSRDIINYYVDNGYLSIQIFFTRNGKLIGSTNKILPITDNIKDDLESYITMFYEKKEHPHEILAPNDLDLDLLTKATNIPFIYVSRGPKKKLIDLAHENAKINLENNFKEIQKNIERNEGANEELEKLLGIKIHRIESFDNSNLFGSYAVSGMVVYIDGRPAKNEYRKYKVSVDVNDDFHTMKEVTYRRYFRALVEHSELPDVILVDGGKAQIKAVNETLETLNLKDKIKVCGLIKNDKHMTNDLMDGDTLEIYNIDRTSNLFHYLTRIQDEVHRFTITYHRELRSKGSLSSILDNIDGIGKVRRNQLLKKYGSLTKINNASVDELSEILPNDVAINLKKYLSDYLNSKNK